MGKPVFSRPGRLPVTYTKQAIMELLLKNKTKQKLLLNKENAGREFK